MPHIPLSWGGLRTSTLRKNRAEIINSKDEIDGSSPKAPAISKISLVETRGHTEYATLHFTHSLNACLRDTARHTTALCTPTVFIGRDNFQSENCKIFSPGVERSQLNWKQSWVEGGGGGVMSPEFWDIITTLHILWNARATDNGPFTCHPHGMDPVVFTLHVLDGEKPAELYTNASCGGVRQLEVIIAFVCLAAVRLLS
ncbi:unnamed protein product, partial [Meganyctiphanes norvegica]